MKCWTRRKKETPSIAADPGIYAGRILDCDAHLYLEPEDMAELVGDVGAGFVLEYLRKYVGSDQDRQARAEAKGDLWASRESAPTVRSMPRAVSRRWTAWGCAHSFCSRTLHCANCACKTAAARAVCRRYNDYVIDWTHQTGDRARAVCQINMSDVVGDRGT